MVSRITRKLNGFYDVQILLLSKPEAYLNLSSSELSENQCKLLKLGTKCHFKPKFNQMEKKVELEVLYESILKLYDAGKITIDPNLKPQLLAESTKCRDRTSSQLMNRELFKAASELKNHPNIIFRVRINLIPL